MKVAIIFDSNTGTTAAAAEEMAALIREAGHECSVSPVADADPSAVRSADALCIGSWCNGLFFVLQHATPATMKLIDGLDQLDGKPVAVFCTYKTAVGGMLREMAARLESRGARVTGLFKSRGPHAAPDFGDWIESLTHATADGSHG